MFEKSLIYELTSGKNNIYLKCIVNIISYIEHTRNQFLWLSCIETNNEINNDLDIIF